MFDLYVNCSFSNSRLLDMGRDVVSNSCANVEGLVTKIAETMKNYFMPAQTISPRELREYLKYAATSAAAHNSDSKWLDGLDLEIQTFSPFEMRTNRLQGCLSRTGSRRFKKLTGCTSVSLPGDNLSVHQKCLFDRRSGLKIIIVNGHKETIIAFGARGSGDSELINVKARRELEKTQTIIAGLGILGAKVKIYENAFEIVKAILKTGRYKGKEITLVGQCFGGTIASYVGMRAKLRVINFNAMPLGVGLQDQIGKQALIRGQKYITNFSVREDLASDNKQLIISKYFVNFFLGLRTPKTFGKKYTFPSAYDNMFETHSYVMGSIMKYLGHDIRTLPADVIERGITI